MFDESFSRIGYFGGVDVTLPAYGRIAPFIRCLAGGVHDSSTFGMTEGHGNAFAFAIGGGVRFGLRPRLAANAVALYAPAVFGDVFQQNIVVNGGVTYDLDSDAPSAGSGSTTVSVANPFASALARDEADYRKKKTDYDQAQKEIEGSDAAWMKKNLTPQGQKAAQSYKDDEAKAKEAFNKAADAARQSDRRRSDGPNARLRCRRGHCSRGLEGGGR